MCLYPKFIKNPKYLPNKKNNYNPPFCKDKRLLYVPIACGQCEECRKQLKNTWRVRLSEELKVNKGIFVTLTFSDESLKTLENDIKNEDSKEEINNKIATLAVRRFLERYRKKNKKSLRHWLITELGQDKEYTHRIHLHGIIFKNLSIDELKNYWKYGRVDIGYSCSLRAINYLIKYVLKYDEENEDFKSKILCSAGLGANGIQYRNCTFKGENGEKTNEYHVLKSGQKTTLPMYFRNKIYSETEREKLWINKLNKKEIYIMGTKYRAKTVEDLRLIELARKNAQIHSEMMGYKKPKWNKKQWHKDFENLNF